MLYDHMQRGSRSSRQRFAGLPRVFLDCDGRGTGAFIRNFAAEGKSLMWRSRLWATSEALGSCRR